MKRNQYVCPHHAGRAGAWIARAFASARLKSQCRQCKGASICPHQRRKSDCRECGGAGVCPHQRRRRACKECAAAASGASSHSALRFDMAALPFDPALALARHPGQGARAAGAPGASSHSAPAVPQVAPRRRRRWLLSSTDPALAARARRRSPHQFVWPHCPALCCNGGHRVGVPGSG